MEDSHTFFSLSLSPTLHLICLSDEDEHPAVREGEAAEEYQARTQRYWLGLARSNMGPDAKDKKVAKVAVAMAKVFYEDR